jgi:hypothetical protein
MCLMWRADLELLSYALKERMLKTCDFRVEMNFPVLCVFFALNARSERKVGHVHLSACFNSISTWRLRMEFGTGVMLYC